MVSLRLKRLLYALLGRRRYLAAVSSLYFQALRSGLLKTDPLYAWHHYVPRLLRPGDVVLDIGANLGYFACIFADAVGAEGRVLCVEPIGVHVDVLRRAVKGRPQVVIVPFALGRDPRKISMGVPSGVPFRHGLTREIQPGAASRMEVVDVVEVRRPDEVLEGLQRLDYVKCDVEGAEVEIFDALKPWLERFRPLVQLESAPEHREHLWKLFTSLGYSAHSLQGEQLSPIPGAATRTFGDWLWVPESQRARVGG